MESNSDSQVIKNDYRPDFSDGKPTELQIIREFSFLFDYVLNGYSVPFQLRKFLFKLFTLTKDDKIYSISDKVLAAQLGDVSRNYVVNLRKKLKAWFNSENENGIRNYPFVSVTENKFDTKTNKQKPTEYAFSMDFIELLQRLNKSARSHRKYKENWIIAIKETCAAEKEGKLLDFGYWTTRKKKRERSADNVLGTYLLNWKRTTVRLLEFLCEQGFEARKTKDVLLHILPQVLEHTFNEMIVDEPNLPYGIKGTNNDFQMFFQLAIDYVNAREDKAEIVFLKNFYGVKNDVRSNDGRANFVQSNETENRNEFSNDIRRAESRGESKTKTNLDKQRLKFMEKFRE